MSLGRAVLRNIDDPRSDPEARAEAMRLIEAVLFAAAEPLSVQALTEYLPQHIDVYDILHDLSAFYANRGVQLMQAGGRWAFRTAPDLYQALTHQTREPRKVSRAAMEILAIIAYHQPVTRAEIEEIRGVSTSKGTLDVLMEAGWVRLRGRRQVPGRPVTYGTTPAFLDHFALERIEDLPGLDELKAMGLMDARLSQGEPRFLEDTDP
jgi:segregation and condensation protein B